MNILCTICARGGSKGIKNKNIRTLCGKPLIAYTIEQALGWGRATDVVVSTDSPKISATAAKYGAKVPFMRPENLAQDVTPKLVTIRHALSQCEKIFGKTYDIVTDLDVTSPFRKLSDLDNCLNIFLRRKLDVLFSVVEARKNPYFNMVELDKHSFARLCKKAPGSVCRRQDAPPVFEMNASIYFYRRDFLMNKSNCSPVNGRCGIYCMDEISAHDIDKELDLKFAEFLIKEGA